MLIERGTIVGSYRVEGILGRGGMGVVYSASLTTGPDKPRFIDRGTHQ